MSSTPRSMLLEREIPVRSKAMDAKYRKIRNAQIQEASKAWANANPGVKGEWMARKSGFVAGAKWYDDIYPHKLTDEKVMAAKEDYLRDMWEKTKEARGLGFESGGVAAAHAVHNGFCSLEECHKMYHGEKVAFGVITQLVMEDSPEEELNEVLDFCVSVGLPITLKQIGVEEYDYEKILKVATIACAPTDTAVNMPFEVNPEMIADAIIAADAIGRKKLG